MSRRILALLVAVGLAAPASAQGLTTFFATGPKDGEPSGVAFSFHHLSIDPAVLALTQFNVLGANPAGTFVSGLGDGALLPVADISPAHPFYLPLTGGGFAFGTGPYPASVLSSYPNLNANALTSAPTGPVPTLSVTLTQPDGGKAGSLAYTASDADGGLVGGATLAIPFGGWWVLGFGSVNQPVVDPLPVDPLPPTVDPVQTANGNPNGPAPTPEPATLLLAGIGLAGAAVARKRRGRVN